MVAPATSWPPTLPATTDYLPLLARRVRGARSEPAPKVLTGSLSRTALLIERAASIDREPLLFVDHEPPLNST
jgi:hypothetical protein